MVLELICQHVHMEIVMHAAPIIYIEPVSFQSNAHCNAIAGFFVGISAYMYFRKNRSRLIPTNLSSSEEQGPSAYRVRPFHFNNIENYCSPSKHIIVIMHGKRTYKTIRIPFSDEAEVQPPASGGLNLINRSSRIKLQSFRHNFSWI